MRPLIHKMTGRITLAEKELGLGEGDPIGVEAERLTELEWAAIREHHTTKCVVPDDRPPLMGDKEREPVIDSKFDLLGAMIEALQKKIIKWWGFGDKSGAEVPLSPQAIEALCQSEGGFAIGVQILARIRTSGIGESEAKNSERAGSGNSAPGAASSEPPAGDA